MSSNRIRWHAHGRGIYHVIIFAPSARTRELELAGEVMAEWSVQETRSLLGINDKLWGDADVQSKLDSVVRNRTIYEQIRTSNGGGEDPVPSPSISDCSVPEGDTAPDPSTSGIVTPVPSTTTDSGGKHIIIS